MSVYVCVKVCHNSFGRYAIPLQTTVLKCRCDVQHMFININRGVISKIMLVECFVAKYSICKYSW